MKKISLYIITFGITFSSIMEIDSSMIKDSQKSFRWSIIPIVSQGQMYNEKYLKSFFYAGAQAYSLSKMLNFNKLIDEDAYYSSGASNDQANYNIIQRNTYGWWFVGMYALSIIDAFIDAELTTFPKELK